MGTKIAPSYANLFIYDLEDRLLYSAPHRPLVWWRFIDDIFCIWCGDQDSLDEFINYINSTADPGGPTGAMAPQKKPKLYAPPPKKKKKRKEKKRKEEKKGEKERQNKTPQLYAPSLCS